jgi:hypothetical protein
MQHCYIRKYVCILVSMTCFWNNCNQIDSKSKDWQVKYLYRSSPQVYSGVRVTRSLVLCVCFVDRCLSLCPFILCPSSMYGFWLTLWYLQTLITCLCCYLFGDMFILYDSNQYTLLFCVRILKGNKTHKINIWEKWFS